MCDISLLNYVDIVNFRKFFGRSFEKNWTPCFVVKYLHIMNHQTTVVWIVIDPMFQTIVGMVARCCRNKRQSNMLANHAIKQPMFALYILLLFLCWKYKYKCRQLHNMGKGEGEGEDKRNMTSHVLFITWKEGWQITQSTQNKSKKKSNY